MNRAKRFLVILMGVLVVLAMATRTFLFYSEAAVPGGASEEKSYRAEVSDICGAKYFPAVKKALSEAKKSIFMVMFVVGLRPYDRESSVYQLMEELIKAHKRGVKVTVILDQNIGFAGREDIDEWQVEGKNAWCFKMLKEAGITVWYDDATKYTHAKTIVIDGETVILGSANWTQSALFKNFETNVLIKSRELAKGLLEDFGKIKIDKKVSSLVGGVEAPVPLSWRFLEKPELGGRMMTKHDERAFDLYLLLLKEFDGNPKAEIILDYEKMAKSLGLYEKMSRTGYRREINRSLEKLVRSYNLIRVETQYGKEGKVGLLDYEKPEKVYRYPEEWYFQVPANYWGYGWNKRFSMRAKFCYLINLAYVSISDAKPWWFASREVLSKRFNVDKWTLSKGMEELRRLNIIDVEYPPLERNIEGRLAKSYNVLELYDPVWLEKEWDRLEMVYGGNNLKKARRYGKIVFEENDPQVIEDIIKRMDTFGERKVKMAFDIVAKKRPDNPKRCYLYVKGIIDKSR